jgi:hypothetical protein
MPLSLVPEYIRLFCKLDGGTQSEYYIHLTWTEIGNNLNEAGSQTHCIKGILIRSEEIDLHHFTHSNLFVLFWWGIHGNATSESAVWGGVSKILGLNLSVVGWPKVDYLICDQATLTLEVMKRWKEPPSVMKRARKLSTCITECVRNSDVPGPCNRWAQIILTGPRRKLDVSNTYS